MSPRNYCYDTEFLEDGETRSGSGGVMSTPVPGHCGTCGIGTNRLPCWNCELEQRIQRSLDGQEANEP